MKNAFIIHGAHGTPQENWFPWLKEELEKVKYQVFVPQFPTPEDQNLDSWLSVFEEYRQYINEETIFVAHSIGPAFVLSILESIEIKIRAAFLVAPFTELLNNEEVDEINKTFVQKEFNWQKIKENCEKFFVFFSENDPYVPVEASRKVADNINAEFIKVEGAGHFNEATGYTKFEQLLTLVEPTS